MSTNDPVPDPEDAPIPVEGDGVFVDQESDDA